MSGYRNPIFTCPQANHEFWTEDARCALMRFRINRQYPHCPHHAIAARAARGAFRKAIKARREQEYYR